jgi:sigma-B regulation protein RsbQ
MRLCWTRFIVTLAAALFTATAPAASVDGADIHWTQSGSGEHTVIFVHGWTCDETAWSAQVPVVSRNYRVITLDLPGHGHSGSPASGKFSMSLFASAVEAVRSEAGVDRAVLVGHSMGVPVIREYALMFPERATSLVLVDGGVFTPDQEPPFAELPVFTGEGVLETRENFIRGMFSPATPAAVQDRVLKMMLSAPEATATGAFEALFDRTQWRPDQVMLPVLGIYAEQSFSANPDLLKTVFPKPEFNVLPGTAHFLMMEKPDDFNKLLTDFLKRIY